jgi:ferric-dicitrate binding protein FerR (iron transport regulator)
MITDELLFRYLNQETNSRENRIISDWLSANPDQETRLNRLREVQETPESIVHEEETAYHWATLETELQPGRKTIRMKPAIQVSLLKVAAVILLLAGTGLLWMFQSNNHVIRNKDQYTKSILLPDGTQVDVKSDPEHPFTVKAGLAKIKVTGTQFVVNAQPRSDEVEVSVKSGNVLFYNSEVLDKNSFRMGLVAGEKGIFYPAKNRMDKTRDPYFQSTP